MPKYKRLMLRAMHREMSGSGEGLWHRMYWVETFQNAQRIVIEATSFKNMLKRLLREESDLYGAKEIRYICNRPIIHTNVF